MWERIYSMEENQMVGPLGMNRQLLTGSTIDLGSADTSNAAEATGDSAAAGNTATLIAALEMMTQMQERADRKATALSATANAYADGFLATEPETN